MVKELDIDIVDETTLHLSSNEVPSYDINRRLVSKGIQVVTHTKRTP
ncbi:hypothetical protein [Dolosigranulum pigrum]|nr:hypothetical protein [Dolosigranulum pigrum]